MSKQSFSHVPERKWPIEGGRSGKRSSVRRICSGQHAHTEGWGSFSSSQFRCLMLQHCSTSIAICLTILASAFLLGPSPEGVICWNNLVPDVLDVEFRSKKSCVDFIFQELERYRRVCERKTREQTQRAMAEGLAWTRILAMFALKQSCFLKKVPEHLGHCVFVESTDNLWEDSRQVSSPPPCGRRNDIPAPQLCFPPWKHRLFRAAAKCWCVWHNPGSAPGDVDRLLLQIELSWLVPSPSFRFVDDSHEIDQRILCPTFLCHMNFPSICCIFFCVKKSILCEVCVSGLSFFLSEKQSKELVDRRVPRFVPGRSPALSPTLVLFSFSLRSFWSPFLISLFLNPKKPGIRGRWNERVQSCVVISQTISWVSQVRLPRWRESLCLLNEQCCHLYCGGSNSQLVCHTTLLPHQGGWPQPINFILNIFILNYYIH